MNPLAEGIQIAKPANDPAPVRRVASRVLATWPVGTFVENLVVRPNGTVLVVVHSTNQVELVAPSGERSIFATLPGPIAGPALIGGDLYVNVSAPGQPPGWVYRVDTTGLTARVVEIPNALFLNGAAPFFGRRILVGDAVRGCIYEVDTEAGTSALWLEHAAMKKVTAEPWLPGINGLKVLEGAVYFSNTDAAKIHRVPFDRTGRPLTVETVAERLTCDDFAFDMKRNLYATTHVHNSLTRLSPDGERVVVANAEDGLAGATAVAFGRGHDDASSLYVTTTGGILAPYEGRVQEAKLVRIDVGAEGAPTGPIESV